MKDFAESPVYLPDPEGVIQQEQGQWNGLDDLLGVSPLSTRDNLGPLTIRNVQQRRLKNRTGFLMQGHTHQLNRQWDASGSLDPQLRNDFARVAIPAISQMLQKNREILGADQRAERHVSQRVGRNPEQCRGLGIGLFNLRLAIESDLSNGSKLRRRALPNLIDPSAYFTKFLNEHLRLGLLSFPTLPQILRRVGEPIRTTTSHGATESDFRM